MMRYLLIGLAVVVVAVGIHAQFSVPQQPMFANAPADEIEIGTNLAHRWTQLDLATNTSFNTWTDRITGTHFLGTFTTHVMSNTADGVLFAAAGSALTNRWGINSNLWLINGDTSLWTNWAVGYIMRVNAPYPNNVRSFNGFAVNNWNHYSYPSGRLIFGTTGVGWNWFHDVLELWPETNNFFELVVGSTNRTIGGTARGFTYINGHFSTNFTTDLQTHTPPKNFGIYDFSTFPVPDTFGARMNVREIWVRTNLLENATQINAFVADLHRANRTIYGYPEDTITNTPLAIYDVNALNFADGTLVDSLTNFQTAGLLDLTSGDTNRPYWTNSVSEINNQGYLHFDGTNTQMAITNSTVYSQPTHIVMVLRTEAMTGITRYIFDNTDSSLQQSAFQVSEDGGMYINSGSSVGATIGATRMHDWKIWEMRFNGVGGNERIGSYVRTNGVYGATAVGDSTGNGRKGLILGNSRLGTQRSKINVAWMGIFTNAPSWYARSNLLYQLSNRYGITAYYP